MVESYCFSSSRALNTRPAVFSPSPVVKVLGDGIFASCCWIAWLSPWVAGSFPGMLYVPIWMPGRTLPAESTVAPATP